MLTFKKDGYEYECMICMRSDSPNLKTMSIKRDNGDQLTGFVICRDCLLEMRSDIYIEMEKRIVSVTVKGTDQNGNSLEETLQVEEVS